MRHIVVDEINDVEVVAGDWCEAAAHDLLRVTGYDAKGNISVETEQGLKLLTPTELFCCYNDVKYLGAGRYSCTTLREVETLTDEEVRHRQ